MSDLPIQPLTLLPNQTATDQVFDALHAALISVQLAPGTKVSEADIAKKLDVSRQPVRDAFFRLSKLGFLAIRPQRATLVTKISEQAVLDAVFVRIALEVECVRHAIDRLTDADAGALRKSLGQQHEALNNKDKSVFHALDEAFHEDICRIAGHTHAWDLILEQKAHMDRVRFLTLSETRRQTVYRQHSHLVASMIKRDADAAERQIREHLGEIRQTLEQTRTEHATYFDAS
ncbi:GntR family transcriptional regulator [Meridianimarinicoccus aquatilis]|uniref:GntR family transcriptional regulator n=1 Tax=Meridianimarinicoccus aquatilis TaxID=2552766 RepID=A0A4R6B0A9_9RHOB|nr:GntR family transcriptional regulator [Fluviibacterium aquatile]TDL90541.1 GntR family transcriptional regulator [Fluviibacterium aquatile]